MAVFMEYTRLGQPAPRSAIEGMRLVDDIPGLDLARAAYGDAPQIPGGGMFLLRKRGDAGWAR